MGTWRTVSSSVYAEILTDRAVRRVWFVLILVALSAAAVNTQAYGVEYQRHVQRVQENLQLQLEREYLVAWEPATILRAIRAPSPGTVFIRGTDRHLPPFFDFEPDGVVWGADVEVAAHAASGQRVDLPWLVVYPLGLFTLLLGVQRVRLARQRGTWRTWRHLGASAGFVLTAELTGCLRVLLAIWASIVLVSAVAVGLTADWAGAGHLLHQAVLAELASALMLLTLPAVTFLFLLLAMGLCLGSWRKGATDAYVFGVAGWAVIAILAPLLPSSMGTLALGPADRGAMENARRTAFANLVKREEEDLGNWLLELGGGGDFDHEAAMEKHRARIERRWDAAAITARGEASGISETWAAREAAIGESTAMSAILSPASLLHWASAEAAGTGQVSRDLWLEAVDRYQRQLNQLLFDNRHRILLRVPSGKTREFYQLERHPWLDPDKAPRFVEPKTAVTLRALLLPILPLVLYCAAGVSGSVWMLRRVP